VADQKSHVIRKVDMTTGATSLIAGSGAAGYAGDDNDKKGGSSAEFSKPSGVVLTPDDKYAIVVDSGKPAAEMHGHHDDYYDPGTRINKMKRHYASFPTLH
jgi:hypothetical protein